MARFALLALLLLIAGASAPRVADAEPLDVELKRARAEAAAADAAARRFEAEAAKARGEAAKLRAEQGAAAEAIAAAEARISAADAQLKMVSATLAARRQRLLREQAPASGLLAGLATMAQRPPLLAILDRGTAEEFVRVRLLLDSTLPVIRRRTAALAAEIGRGRRLEQAAVDARAALVAGRDELAAKRQAFAELEAKALLAAERSGGAALGAGDVALAMEEESERLTSASSSGRGAARRAAELARLGPAPPRPFRAEGGASPPAIAYSLPAAAPVTDGFGSVSTSGIRSRGITLATARGAALTAPAAGTVAFAGPFREHDGIIIIDHGGGWISLIANAATPLERGAKVRRGEPLGRALGPISVELSRHGQRLSPALIAGSSQTLSNRAKSG
ncbi:peptidoglycan DD-metalloendopeptidase family protein [Sphingomonas sp.]|uniref:murein hydrolase activator EnvC family protein n=1 Tax=Sphingomonas sp. TaxID=28214 RepID=UPI00286D6DE9|nr:peptidoglycan DD-metalloendopeptidase family protein [Sphingomonas sp.]